MTQAEYEIHRNALLDMAACIEAAKRPAYVQGKLDVLHNFKSNAVRMGITPLQCIGIYWGKHVDAITSYLKDPNIKQAEDITGRLADCINYLKLIHALIQEDAEEVKRYIENGAGCMTMTEQSDVTDELWGNPHHASSLAGAILGSTNVK